MHWNYWCVQYRIWIRSGFKSSLLIHHRYVYSIMITWVYVCRSTIVLSSLRLYCSFNEATSNKSSSQTNHSSAYNILMTCVSVCQITIVLPPSSRLQSQMKICRQSVQLEMALLLHFLSWKRPKFMIWDKWCGCANSQSRLDKIFISILEC